MGEKLDIYLTKIWESMQDNHRDNYLKFTGAVDLALACGLITPEKHELWNYHIKNCPNPEHADGRVWCAYCGDIEYVDNDIK